MAYRRITPESAVFTSNSVGSISQNQILGVFEKSSQWKVTLTVGVPWFGKFNYECVLTFPKGTWLSDFDILTTGYESIWYHDGQQWRRIYRSSTYKLSWYKIDVYKINDFVSKISWGTTTWGTGGSYKINFLLATGSSDSGLRVRGKDGKVYWIGTDPNSKIKIRNKSGQIVGLDYGSISDSRASPCRIRRKDSSVVALRWIKKV